jgi:CRISPR/Cas system-associated exonuclease Cas4 (RecB family)
MIELDFNQIIGKYVQNKNESRKKELIIGKYNASAIGNCTRKNYYAYTSPIELPLQKLCVFEAGNIIHDFIAKVLGDSEGITLVSNERDLGLVDLETDLMVSGRLDDMIMIQKNGEKIIIEVKSAKSLEYFDAPKSSHIAQLAIYLKALQPYGIRKGIILYVDKNTLKTKSFEVEYDHEILTRAIQRARTLHRHLLSKTLPPAEAKSSMAQNWECGFCEYSDKCNLDNGGKWYEQNKKAGN